MDTTDPEIVFDEEGVCNHYHEYQEAARTQLLPPEARKQRLAEVVAMIKAKGRGRPYDCLIGLSGGVDSTYVAYLVKQLGLKPLAVHLDNGWDSELAVRNIENIVKKLDIDLHTVVIDWEEFRRVQLAYLRASVVDIEVVSDHAIFASMYRVAREYRAPSILSGTNIVTEFIMPRAWLYHKMDLANLLDIYRKHGNGRLKTFPTCGFWRNVYYSAVRGLVPVSILNLVEYNKSEAKAIIARELEWRDYGGKHYESIFTRFYQAYILPTKFGIDKRRAHYSTLICSGQMTREEALERLEEPLYEPRAQAEDLAYVCKKLELSESEFETIMSAPPRPHSDFASEQSLRTGYQMLLRRTSGVRQAVKRVFTLGRGGVR